MAEVTAGEWRMGGELLVATVSILCELCDNPAVVRESHRPLVVALAEEVAMLRVALAGADDAAVKLAVKRVINAHLAYDSARMADHSGTDNGGTVLG